MWEFQLTELYLENQRWFLTTMVLLLTYVFSGFVLLSFLDPIKVFLSSIYLFIYIYLQK